MAWSRMFAMEEIKRNSESLPHLTKEQIRVVATYIRRTQGKQALTWLLSLSANNIPNGLALTGKLWREIARQIDAQESGLF